MLFLCKLRWNKHRKHDAQHRRDDQSQHSGQKNAHILPHARVTKTDEPKRERKKRRIRDEFMLKRQSTSWMQSKSTWPCMLDLERRTSTTTKISLIFFSYSHSLFFLSFFQICWKGRKRVASNLFVVCVHFCCAHKKKFSKILYIFLSHLQMYMLFGIWCVTALQIDKGSFAFFFFLSETFMLDLK